MVKINKKLIKFMLYIFSQIIISTVIILLFKQIFDLNPIVVIGHLFVLSCLNIIVIIFGVLLCSTKLQSYQKITKYLVSSLFGLLFVLLYYTHLFAFLGKYLNSRIYTLQIVFSYLKSFTQLIATFSANPFLIYIVLFIVPMIVFIANLFLAQLIQDGILNFKKLILQFNFNNPPVYIRYSMVLLLFFLGFASGIILLKHSSIYSRLFIMEEPIVSVFLKNNDPFQGQIISNNNEDHLLRRQYPKNIKFQKKNIIIITVDALRSDHLSLFDYKRKTSPFIDSLYSSGNLKKVALSFSVAGASFSGINGILRSKIWANMGYINFSIQQLLKDQGYNVNFLVSGDHTNFFGLKSFYGNNSDINYYIDSSVSKKYTTADDKIIFEGLNTIKKYKNNPSFFYFHLNSAHFAGVRQNQFKAFLPANANELNIENYTNRYDNGIIQADDNIKNIFKTLSTKGYLQNSIVVITADHGEGLSDKGKFGHGWSVYTNQILIPILIYDTEKVSYKNLSFATSVDIAPTIIDRLGLPIPPSWEGKSLYSEEQRAFTFHQMADYYAVIYSLNDKRLKYIFNSKTKKEELFELNTDLYETKNIINKIDLKYLTILRDKLIEFRLSPDK